MFKGGIANVLDLGGGNAFEANYLAARSQKIYVIDPAICDKEIGNVRQIKKYAENFLAEENVRDYDLIMLHNSLGYMSDYEYVLKAVCDLLPQQGVLSILNVNPISDLVKSIIDGRNDWVGRRMAPYYRISSLSGEKVVRFPVNYVLKKIEANGLRVISCKGIRRIYINDPENISFDDLYDREKRWSSSATGFSICRFYHVLARKPFRKP